MFLQAAYYDEETILRFIVFLHRYLNLRRINELKETTYLLHSIIV